MVRGAEPMARAGEGRVIEQDAIKAEQSASQKDRYAIKSEKPEITGTEPETVIEVADQFPETT